MEYVTLADFRAQLGKMWEKVAEDGALVVTRNGKPFVLVTETDEVFVQEELHALSRARAEISIQGIRQKMAEQGLNELTLNDINAEIARARTGESA